MLVVLAIQTGGWREEAVQTLQMLAHAKARDASSGPHVGKITDENVGHHVRCLLRLILCGVCAECFLVLHGRRHQSSRHGLRATAGRVASVGSQASELGQRPFVVTSTVSRKKTKLVLMVVLVIFSSVNCCLTWFLFWAAPLNFVWCDHVFVKSSVNCGPRFQFGDLVRELDL